MGNGTGGTGGSGKVGGSGSSGNPAPQGGGGASQGDNAPGGSAETTSAQGPTAAGSSPTATGSSPTASGTGTGSIWNECGMLCGTGGRYLWNVSNFFAGAGDKVLFGGTKYLRRGTSWIVGNGYGDNVNYGGGAYGAGGVLGGTVRDTLITAAVPTAWARLGKYGSIFGRGDPGRGIARGILNRGLVRFGWSWEGTATAGRNVIRLGIGAARGTRWWNHIPFWYP